MEHTLSINKDDVYNEVYKTTSYTGENIGDKVSYELIPITEDD